MKGWFQVIKIEEMNEKVFLIFLIFMGQGVIVFEGSRKERFLKIIPLCQKEMKIIFE